MNYITTKQASEAWQISPTRITVLAKSGRIPGAVQIGRSWMIPEDSKKPEDMRKAQSRTNSDSTDYVFPLVYAGNYSDIDAQTKLTPEQKKLYHADILLERGKFSEAEAELRELLDTTDNKYIRIGALYFSSMAHTFLDEPKKAITEANSLCLLLSEEDVHKKELSLILADVNELRSTDDRFFDNISYDPKYHYSEEAKIHLTVQSIYSDCINCVYNSTHVNPIIDELSCQTVEQAGYYFYAVFAHCYVAIIFATLENKTSSNYHFKRAIELAHEHGIYVSLIRASIYFRSLFNAALSEYPELADRFSDRDNALQRSFAAYQAHNGRKEFLSMSDDDYRLIGYVIQKFTIKDIAHREKKSEKTINKHLARIYDLVGVSGKDELASYFSVNR